MGAGGDPREELFSSDGDGQDPTSGWEEERGAQLRTAGSLPWPWCFQGRVCSAPAGLFIGEGALVAPLSSVYCIIFPFSMTLFKLWINLGRLH